MAVPNVLDPSIHLFHSIWPSAFLPLKLLVWSGVHSKVCEEHEARWVQFTSWGSLALVAHFQLELPRLLAATSWASAASAFASWTINRVCPPLCPSGPAQVLLCTCKLGSHVLGLHIWCKHLHCCVSSAVLNVTSVAIALSSQWIFCSGQSRVTALLSVVVIIL